MFRWRWCPRSWIQTGPAVHDERGTLQCYAQQQRAALVTVTASATSTSHHDTSELLIVIDDRRTPAWP
jgi:hypothetical protein